MCRVRVWGLGPAQPGAANHSGPVVSQLQAYTLTTFPSSLFPPPQCWCWEGYPLALPLLYPPCGSAKAEPRASAASEQIGAHQTEQVSTMQQQIRARHQAEAGTQEVEADKDGQAAGRAGTSHVQEAGVPNDVYPVS